jgi:hypothetical protein
MPLPSTRPPRLVVFDEDTPTGEYRLRGGDSALAEALGSVGEFLEDDSNTERQILLAQLEARRAQPAPAVTAATHAGHEPYLALPSVLTRPDPPPVPSSGALVPVAEHVRRACALRRTLRIGSGIAAGLALGAGFTVWAFGGGEVAPSATPSLPTQAATVEALPAPVTVERATAPAPSAKPAAAAKPARRTKAKSARASARRVPAQAAARAPRSKKRRNKATSKRKMSEIDSLLSGL